MTTTLPLSKLHKGAHVHIESIVPNPVFGDLDPMVGLRLAVVLRAFPVIGMLRRRERNMA